MSAQIIPFDAPKAKVEFCSFCKLPKSMCRTFVRGVKANICGACADKAKRRMEETAEVSA